MEDKISVKNYLEYLYEKYLDKFINFVYFYIKVI